MDKLKATLHDQSEDDNSLRTVVENLNGSIYISPKGYGDACSADGCGIPALIEVYEGELRIIIWGDINKEDPTHTISLEGARESNRSDCPYGEEAEKQCTPTRAENDCSFQCHKKRNS